jgi:hypothetical protein
VQIQRSSCDPDPTAVLLSLPRDLATWSTQCLDSQPMNYRFHEISRSLATCPPIWMAVNLSPLRCLTSSCLVNLNTQYLGLYPANPRVRDISSISAMRPSQMDGPDLLTTSLLRDLAPHDFEHPILGPLSYEPPSSQDLSDLCHASFIDGWS